LSTEETPIAVFTNVAHMEHRPTLINEMIKALSALEFLVSVFTIINTNNSQTTGDTGLKICIIQFTELLNVLLKPIIMPMGTATKKAKTNPAKTVFKLVNI